MATLQKIEPCLWFDDQAEAAANFYVSIFPDAAIETVTRYGEAGRAIHRKPPGSVLTVSFRLAGQHFLALNGGPQFRFTEAVSLIVRCETQAEIDHFWLRLGDGGDPEAQQCGWLKDKFGLSWQVVPVALLEMMLDRDASKPARVMKAFMQMKKFDIETLKRAYQGETV